MVIETVRLWLNSKNNSEHVYALFRQLFRFRLSVSLPQWPQSSLLKRITREFFHVIEKLVRCGSGLLSVPRRDRASLGRMQPRTPGEIRSLLVVEVPEAARDGECRRRMDARGELVVGRCREQRLFKSRSVRRKATSSLALGRRLHRRWRSAWNSPPLLTEARSSGARAIKRSSSRRTLEQLQLFPSLISCRQPEFPSWQDQTSSSRASRCNASRMGVRPMQSEPQGSLGTMILGRASG